jgi:hypothetical protein
MIQRRILKITGSKETSQIQVVTCSKQKKNTYDLNNTKVKPAGTQEYRAENLKRYFD